MHRIDSDGHVSNLFTNGVPNVTPATVFDADWANAIQEEILAPIGAAGITPVKGTNGQLLAALQAMFARLGVAGTFTAIQTFTSGKVRFNPSTVDQAGIDSTQTATTSVRRLLLELPLEVGAGNTAYLRLYWLGQKSGVVPSGGLEATINARWNVATSRWIYDHAALAKASRFSFSATALSFSVYNGADSWVDGNFNTGAAGNLGGEMLKVSETGSGFYGAGKHSVDPASGTNLAGFNSAEFTLPAGTSSISFAGFGTQSLVSLQFMGRVSDGLEDTTATRFWCSYSGGNLTVRANAAPAANLKFKLMIHKA